MIPCMDEDKILSIGWRPVRDIGGAIGSSFDKEALNKLGALDEDGEVIEGVEARQVVKEDGTIKLDLSLPGD